MDNLQDLARCHHCETPDPLFHCDVCKMHLCTDCEGKHISDESKAHKLMLFRYRKVIIQCHTHTSEKCEYYCKECNIPICTVCVSSKEHKNHCVVGVSNHLVSKKEALEIDLQELEEHIYPKYQEIVSNITVQKTDMIDSFKKLRADIIEHKEGLQKKIDNTMTQLTSHSKKVEKELLDVLTKLEDESTKIISKIKKCISDIKLLLESNDVHLVTAYKSRNVEFRELPPKVNVTFPRYSPVEIYLMQNHHFFSWVHSFSVKLEELVYSKDSQSAVSKTYDKTSLVNEPRVVSNRNTQYALRSLSCLNDEDVWTCNSDSIMRLYNLKGELVREIHTKSGNKPYDIAVTKKGDLVYTDNTDKTVNISKNNQTQTLIRLRRWKPLGVCCTNSGDLLIVMNNDKISKVVRYSGPTKKQSIKYNEEGQPLYSPGSNNKYICENRNLDMCVSDFEAHAVVVVNQIGKFRFTYTGSPSITLETFNPVGITSDIRSRILIADINSRCIHIINQNGYFLRYIDNCHLYAPFGVCVDTTGNLLVSDYYRGKVKEIQYYKRM